MGAEPLHQLFRPVLFLQQGCLGGGLLVIERQSQYAVEVPVPARFDAVIQQGGGQVTAGVQVSPLIVAILRGVVQAQLGEGDSGGVTRALGGDMRRLFQNSNTPAPPRQAVGDGGARQARTHDRHGTAVTLVCAIIEPEPGFFRRRMLIRSGFLLHVAPQHIPLAAESGHLFHGESLLLQPPLDDACGGKGGNGGAIATQATNLLEQLILPHTRVLGGGKAVQKPGVHQSVQTAEACDRVIEDQGEGDIGLCKIQSMVAPG